MYTHLEGVWWNWPSVETEKDAEAPAQPVAVPTSSVHTNDRHLAAPRNTPRSHCVTPLSRYNAYHVTVQCSE